MIISKRRNSNRPSIKLSSEQFHVLDRRQESAPGRDRNYISKISENKIVLIATHVVSDIEFIARNVFILKKGSLIDSGSVQELNGKVYGKTWEIKVDSNDDLRF